MRDLQDRTAKDVILHLLSEAGEDGIVQADLARSSGFSRSTVSFTLSILERSGLVRRMKVDGDVRVWLTRYAPRIRTKRVRLGLIRALEYPFVIPLRSALRDRGFTLDLKVYDSGLDVMKDLLRGKLEAALAPFIMQLIFHALSGGATRLLMTAAKGGASLIATMNVKAPNELKDNKVASTALSSMEAYVMAALRQHGIEEHEININYKSSAKDLCNALLEKEVEAVSLWEPYATFMELQGHCRIADYLELLEEPLCCVLSIGPSFRGTENLLKEAYSKAYTEFRSMMHHYVEAYLSIMAFPAQPSKKALCRFIFDDHFSFSEAYRTLSKLGLRHLTPSLKSALSHSEDQASWSHFGHRGGVAE